MLRIVTLTALLGMSALAQDDARSKIGMQIAPVPLNMGTRDPQMVGLGSYLVNAVGGCNDCHTNPSYDPKGDPFKGMPKKINAAGYLGGGQMFGPFTSRNITPDGTGEVTGSLSNFTQIIRTGIDLDKQHPQFGPLLQVMPWPQFQSMTDADIKAIYAYLQSIPCLEGGPGEMPNRCAPATPTRAVAGPKGATATSRIYQLDGSASTSADGMALSYQWSIPAGNLQAAILQGATAMPTVQFSSGRGPYTFQLTVTDSAGKMSTDTVTVNYQGN